MSILDKTDPDQMMTDLDDVGVNDIRAMAAAVEVERPRDDRGRPSLSY
jgi:hypothetical protein